MRPEKLVDACTLETEARALAFAVAEERGCHKFLNVAWDAFWVNGTAEQRAELQRELADLQNAIAESRAFDPAVKRAEMEEVARLRGESR